MRVNRLSARAGLGARIYSIRHGAWSDSIFRLSTNPDSVLRQPNSSGNRSEGVKEFECRRETASSPQPLSSKGGEGEEPSGNFFTASQSRRVGRVTPCAPPSEIAAPKRRARSD